MIDISIIIISWNAKEYLLRCLNSIKKSKILIKHEIIVLDNASEDGSQDIVENLFPEIKLIKSEINLGFAKANNVAIKESKAPYVCLINSDVEIDAGCIDKLYEYIQKNSSIGILGPKVLNKDGSLQKSFRNAPNIRNSLARALAIDSLQVLLRRNNEEQSIPKKVDVLTGCFWLIRREALEQIGLLDESFFIYGEDLDLCKRMWEGGWSVIYYPWVEIIHWGGASSSNAPIDFYIEQQRTNFQYWKKHHSKAQQNLFICIAIIHHIIRIFCEIIWFLLFPKTRKYIKQKINKNSVFLTKVLEIIKS